MLVSWLERSKHYTGRFMTFTDWYATATTRINPPTRIVRYPKNDQVFNYSNFLKNYVPFVTLSVPPLRNWHRLTSL